MMHPTIHLNGTHHDDLIGNYLEALNAIRDAIAKVQDTAPHGRDYYPQGPSAITQAMAEHAARLAKLEDVSAELETLVEGVLNGN